MSALRHERFVMREVRIYTARYCPYCTSAKAFLKRKGIPFTEIDIAGNWERRDEMIEQSNGRATVPQIFVGPVHIGGSDELHALDRAGTLDSLLAEPADAAEKS
jgi:glutaredoxin 3